jgi:hypothetical protein
VRDVELLGTPSRVDADIMDPDGGEPRSTHRPAPADASPPEEPEHPPPPSLDGGVDDTSDAGVIDNRPQTLQWVTLAPYPVARGALGAAMFGRVIHLVGGDLDYEGQTPSTAHRVFDPASDTYYGRAVTPDNNQWGPCVIGHNGYLYVFGGWSSGEGVMRRYDGEADRWDYLATSPEKQMWGFACAVVDGVIYVISGSTNDTGSKPTSRVSAYDIATNTWSRKADFPEAKVDLAGAAIGKNVYVVGRGDALDIYDTTTNRWSSGPKVGRDAARGDVLGLL